MSQMNSKKIIAEILSEADIKINGSRPWDIKVKNDDFYLRVLKYRSLGLGESYMDGWWEVDNLDQFFCKIFRYDLGRSFRENKKLGFRILKEILFNPQRKSKVLEVGKVHYDLGNELFELMLDRRMTYTCGYWKNAHTLDSAQEDKLDLVCKKLGLKKGMKVLDIGCGFGSFAKFAAEKYKVKVWGVTISKEQIELGSKLCQGLPVQLELRDYRDITGMYDAVVSLGMFEHVGEKNYRTFMQVVRTYLKDDGLFLLHTIGTNNFGSSKDAFLDKYIFPNGQLPTIAMIGKSIENLFILEDLHSFGAYYDKTLMAWFKNFDSNWPKLKDKYGERFYRMWKFYLLVCAGSFRARHNQLWQIVLSKNGVLGGYTSIR